MSKFVYLVYEYMPKHKARGFIYEGQYKFTPKVFSNYEDARLYHKSYRHASYIKRVKLR